MRAVDASGRIESWSRFAVEARSAVCRVLASLAPGVGAVGVVESRRNILRLYWRGPCRADGWRLWGAQLARQRALNPVRSAEGRYR
jgi:hypothetical protein